MKAHRSSTFSFDGRGSDGRGRRAFHAFCWAAVFVAVADLACRLVLPAGSLVEYEDFVRARVETDPAPDVQVVGDSVARSGFIASAVTDGTTTGRNDAIPGGGVLKSYLLLARQFAMGHIPKALVIAHSPHTFRQVRHEVVIGSFAHWNEVPELVARSDPWTDGLYGVLTRLSYFLMHRDSFRDLLTKGDAGFFLGKEQTQTTRPDIDRIDAFAQALATGTFDWARAGGAVEDFLRHPFVVDETNDYYFRQIIALAKAHGVEVFWVTLPSPRQVIEARASSGYEPALLEYLGQFEARGDLAILRGNFGEYPDEMFRDGLHLNEAGAIRLACELRSISAPVLAVASRSSIVASASEETVTRPVASASARDVFYERLQPFCEVRSPPSNGQPVAVAVGARL
jgi:hypothetical protein